MNVPSPPPGAPSEGPEPARRAAEPIAGQDTDARADEARRRRAEQIVSGMLPDTTADERGQGSGADGHAEQWYRENRPPHHG